MTNVPRNDFLDGLYKPAESQGFDWTKFGQKSVTAVTEGSAAAVKKVLVGNKSIISPDDNYSWRPEMGGG